MPCAVKRGAATTLNHGRDGDEGRERRALWGRAGHAAQGRGATRHAHDGPILGDQGGQRRLSPVLPHGRFLRAVLRGRRDRLARSWHRAHQARQASRRRHPHVRRARPCRRRLSPAPDRGRSPGGGVRADRGPGRGQEARAEGGGAPRRRPPGHAGHAHRGDAARCPRPQFPHRPVPGARQGRQRARLRSRLARYLDRGADRLAGRARAIFRASLPGSSPARFCLATILRATRRFAVRSRKQARRSRPARARISIP